MTTNTDVLFRLAARACLSQCRQSPAPFTALADFLDELRRRGWSDGAVSTVTFIVLKSLRGSDMVSRRPDKRRKGATD